LSVRVPVEIGIEEIPAPLQSPRSSMVFAVVKTDALEPDPPSDPANEPLTLAVCPGPGKRNPVPPWVVDW